MSSIRTRLHPVRDVSEHNILPFYALNQTGLGGMLVKIVTGSANPQTSAMDGFSDTNVGAAYNGTYSKIFKNNWEVQPTASGDTRFVAVGLTLLNTQNVDENDMPLRYNHARAKAIGAVTSGESVPIATAGQFAVWGNYIDTSLGAPQPGHLVVISRSGDGRLGAIAPDSANFAASYGVATTGQTAAQLYNPNQVVGKWLSSLPTSTNTGLANEFAAQGGYAFLSLNCTL